jgi:hypothetical protein
MKMVPAQRVRALNDAPVREGDYVLYWRPRKAKCRQWDHAHAESEQQP